MTGQCTGIRRIYRDIWMVYFFVSGCTVAKSLFLINYPAQYKFPVLPSNTTKGLAWIIHEWPRLPSLMIRKKLVWPFYLKQRYTYTNTLGPQHVIFHVCMHTHIDCIYHMVYPTWKKTKIVPFFLLRTMILSVQWIIVFSLHVFFLRRRKIPFSVFNCAANRRFEPATMHYISDYSLILVYNSWYIVKK